jgi:sulfur carrier protein ThiS
VFSLCPVQAQVNEATSTQKIHIQRTYGLDANTTLVFRVNPTYNTIRLPVMAEGVTHKLTEEELANVEMAVKVLPPLHQRVLKDHLRSIHFLDKMAGTATAMTIPIHTEEAYSLFDIAIRAEVLHQTASEWLTRKGHSCFDTSGSDQRIRVEAGSVPALFYILLHEATHVVDGALNLLGPMDTTTQLATFSFAKAFTKGIWLTRSVVAFDVSDTLLLKIRFWGGTLLPVSKAQQVYESLKQTPFASLYSTTGCREDLAEYLTVYHLTKKLGQPIRWSIVERGKEIVSYEPMRSKRVRSRIKLLKRFYEYGNGS